MPLQMCVRVNMFMERVTEGERQCIVGFLTCYLSYLGLLFKILNKFSILTYQFYIFVSHIHLSGA